MDAQLTAYPAWTFGRFERAGKGMGGAGGVDGDCQDASGWGRGGGVWAGHYKLTRLLLEPRS